MKRVLRWVCCAALCVLALSEAGWANDKKEGQTFTQKQPENYYLAGAVPEVNGKVVFRRELELPGWSQDQIFDKVKEWLVRSEQQDQDIILNRNIVREDKAKGEIYVQNQEYLVFVDRGLSLDRADFSFLQRYICSPGKCVLEVSRLKYVYDNETHMAEGWISDDYALDKNKTKVYPGVRRQRIKTVDRVDELFAGLTGSFMVLQLAQTPVQAGMTGAPSVMFPASQTAPVQSGQVPAAPAATLPLPETQTEPAGLADTQTGEGTALPGYKRIAPQQIPGNIIKMLNDNWMLVTAGNDAKFNMMTASWGGLGVLFGKPVAFCFVSPLRYTWQLLDKGDTYTLSFYTEAYRDALQICGTTSGSDTDKVRATGLTPVTTPSGAKAFGEAWMVVECRKLMQQSLSPGAIVDSAERANWNTKPLNTMFIGEIINVWIK